MNRKGKDIDSIVVHCSAGYGDLASIRRFWRSMGWKTDGYHLWVDLDGTITQVVPFNLPSNGVKGHNAKSIHISYRGGVERNNVNKALDSRTAQQKEGIKRAIYRTLQWIEDSGGNVDKVRVLGHRDFSPDKNKNGIIDSWERIKECPSFNAIPEYKNIIKEYKSQLSSDIEYVVRSGDTLWNIAKKNNTEVKKIIELNNLSSTPVLKVGQRLKIK